MKHYWFARFFAPKVYMSPDEGGESGGSQASVSFDGDANTPYENYVLQNELKDQLKTRMDMLRFCEVDDSLTAAAGTKVTVRVYKGVGGAQKVAEGEGNTKDLSATYEDKEYEVGTTQARFPYTDEQQMKDPTLVETGIRYLSTALTNDIIDDVNAEYKKGTQTVAATGNYSFDNFVDAVAKLELKDDAAGSQQDSAEIFGLMNRTEKARVQKGLKDDLKYVEAYVRTGYIGTVAGVNLYVNDSITDGEVVIGTRKAVKYFRKKNPTTEQDRDKNKRINYLYGRQVGYVALVNDKQLCRIVRSGN